MLRNTIDPVHLLGASGRVGSAVCRALLASGVKVIAIVHDEGHWHRAGLDCEVRYASLHDGYAMRLALADAVRLIACTPPHLTHDIISATEADALMVLLGDARRYLHAPDLDGLTAMEGERVLLGSGRPGVILHPTMIYGMPSNDLVRRWARWLRVLPVLPLPDGGRTLIQPIALDDVVACALAAVDRNWSRPEAVAIGGPTPVQVGTFLRLIAEASGTQMPSLISVPRMLMPFTAPFATMIPGMRLAAQDDLRNLAEDRVVDIAAMRAKLGVEPRLLSQGLAAMFDQSPR